MQTNKLIIAFILLFSIVSQYNTFAQQSNKANVEAMKKLTFLVGEWEGEAKVRQRDGSIETLLQHEKVQWKLEGTVLFIEGLGKTIDPETKDEMVVHNAMGILSYNNYKSTYQFVSYLADGKSQITTGKFNDDGSFSWGMDIPQRGKVNYTIKINEKGQWYEIGEFSRDGENWNQFIEMTLDKL